MVLFPSKGIAEHIVQILHRGPMSAQELRALLERRGVACTKQGVYKALRELRDQEIVFLQREEVQLSARWLQRLSTFVTLSQHAYREGVQQEGHFLQLRDGDTITYAFTHAAHVDAFWNHVLYILFDALPHVDRWFAYSWHHWFLLGRRNEELALMRTMTRRGIRCLFTAGSSSALDALVRKDFDGDMTQFHMRGSSLFPRRANDRGVVLNVFGDYIIEAQYDDATVQRIERFYRAHTRMTRELAKELEGIVSTPGKIRFRISRHAAKARKLVKMLEKSFYLPARTERGQGNDGRSSDQVQDDRRRVSG